MESKKKRRPASIELNDETCELIIEWKDGHQSHFPLAALRRSCPCANCREKRQEVASPGELVLLDDNAARVVAGARRFELVGRYGIRIVWADGHDYGIYTFEALRERDEAGE